MKLYFGERDISSIIQMDHPKPITVDDLDLVNDEGSYFTYDSEDAKNIKNRPKLSNNYASYPFNLKVNYLPRARIMQIYEIPSEAVVFARWKNLKDSGWKEWIRVSFDQSDGDSYTSAVTAIKRIDSYVAGQETLTYTYRNRWRITRVGNTIIETGKFLTYRDFKLTYNDIIAKKTDSGNTIYTFEDDVKIPLDFPISSDHVSIQGSVAEGIGLVCRTKLINNTMISFKLVSMNKDLAYLVNADYPKKSTDNMIRLQVIGEIATPRNISYMPKNTKVEVKTKIANLIQTYFDARDNKTKPVTFAYGDNWFSNTGSNVVVNQYNQPVLQCDAFVGLILMGQSYSDVYGNNWYSDVSTGASAFNQFFNDKKMTESNLNWSYCNKKVDDEKYPNMVSCSAKFDERITYTGSQLFFFWNQKQIFETDKFEQLETGDLIFFTATRPNKSSRYFSNVIHVGIITINNGIPYINQVGNIMTDNGVLGSGSVLSRIELEKYLSMLNHRWDMSYCFARPNYDERENATTLK